MITTDLASDNKYTSYSIDNSDVTALGTLNSGNIVLASLPARTEVGDVLLVIESSGLCNGTFALSVAIGDPSERYIAGGNGKATPGAYFGVGLSNGPRQTGRDITSMSTSKDLLLVLETEDDFLSNVTGFSCTVYVTSRLLTT